MPPENQNPSPDNQPAPEPTPPVPAPAPAPTPPAPPNPEDQLGEAGKRAIQAERDARAKAEREAAEAKRRLKEMEQANESEAQRKEREAEEGRRLAEEGRAALREAKTITALAGQGIIGPTALAAVKLLDGVEYDDANQPTNLSDRLTAAKAVYGEQVFAGATPVPTPSPTTPDPASPALPNLHQGPRDAAAEEEENAAFEASFARMFPQHAETPAT